MRINIIKSLMESPKNANVLSSALGVNYRTIEHHLKVLISNGIIIAQGNNYGKVYFPSPVLIKNINILKEIFSAAGLREDF